MTVIAWGGIGASALMLTWHHGRGGPVWRFPWGHYDPCVPVEGTQTPERTLNLFGVTIPFGRFRVRLGEQRNRREQKSPDGRPQGRT
jgi:hypothetical protein